MNERSHLMPAAIFSVLATSIALVPVFDDQRWFWPGLLATFAAFGIGWVGRRLDVPGVLSPALSAIGLVALLGILYFSDTTAFGLPTRATLEAIGAGLGDAGSDIRRLGPPAEVTDPLNMLATGGIYVVAALVDLIVLRGRRAATAGLPLLALYLVPASLSPKGTTAVPFVVAAAGYLTLLLAEGRDLSRGWGRRLVGVGTTTETNDVSPVSRVGRRLGTAAIGLAVVVPVFIPTLDSNLLRSGVGNDLFGGRGGVTRNVPHPIVSFTRQIREKSNTPLFDVYTSHPDYLRLLSLDIFNGSDWRHAQLEIERRNFLNNGKRPIPLPYGVDPNRNAVTVDYRIQVGDQLESSWLPLMYAPRRVKAGGDWGWEPRGASVASSRDDTVRLSYEATSVIPQPDPDYLRSIQYVLPSNGSMELYTRLPRGDEPAIVSRVLDEVTSDQVSMYEKMLALQEFFRDPNEFTYTLDVEPGTGTGNIWQFLSSRRGYCEQFASAMAYFARRLGAASRVAVGYTPGRRVGDNHYQVTTDDAHAWPEIWFPEVGWVRFEPTPRDGSDRPSYATPSTPDPNESAQPSASASAEPSSSANPSASAGPSFRDPDESFSPGANSGADGDGGPPLGGWRTVWILAALLLAATPGTAGALLRGARWKRADSPAEACHAAWASVVDTAEDAGRPLRAADSPRASASRIVSALSLTGAPADALMRIAAAEEKALFARTPEAPDDLNHASRLVRATLIGTLDRRAKARALLLPPSVLRRAREGGSLAFDAFERAQTRLGRRMRALVRRKAPQEG